MQKSIINKLKIDKMKTIVACLLLTGPTVTVQAQVPKMKMTTPIPASSCSTL